MSELDRVTPDLARDYARAFAEYIPPCPYNPFPVSSPWGAEIERQWQAQQRSARRRRVTPS